MRGVHVRQLSELTIRGVHVRCARSARPDVASTIASIARGSQIVTSREALSLASDPKIGSAPRRKFSLAAPRRLSTAEIMMAVGSSSAPPAGARLSVLLSASALVLSACTLLLFVLSSHGAAAHTGALALAPEAAPRAQSGVTAYLPVPVIGEVVDDGTVFRGLGFSVVHRDRGTYDLTFDPPFAIPPVIVVSPQAYGVCYTRAVTESAATVHCMTDLLSTAPRPENIGFTFYAGTTT